MKLTANYHTHTSRCGHASGSDREYIEAAIRAGFKTLGFSDHTPMIFASDHHSGHRMPLGQAEEYFASLTALKREYAADIRVLIGVETEYYPATHERYMDFMRDYPCDYMLLGQHYLLREEDGIVAVKPHGETELLRLYYRNVLEGLRTGDFLYAAHPDMFCFTGAREDYDRETRAFLEQVKALDVPVEINRLGLYDKRCYPNERFWQIAGEVGNTAVIGADAHTPGVLEDADTLSACAALASKYGIALRTELL